MLNRIKTLLPGQIHWEETDRFYVKRARSKWVGRVIVERSQSETYRGGNIIIPDIAKHVNSTFKVLMHSTHCHYCIKVNQIVMLPWNSEMIELEDNIFLVDASKIFGVFKNGRVFPLGATYLVERHVEEEVTPSGIILAEGSFDKFQTLEVTILEKGIPEAGSNHTIHIPTGTHCKLQEWTQTQVEIGHKTMYGLVVHESELEACYA